QRSHLLDDEGASANELAARGHSGRLGPTTYGARRSTRALEDIPLPDAYQLRGPGSSSGAVTDQLEAWRPRRASVKGRSPRRQAPSPDPSRGAAGADALPVFRGQAVWERRARVPQLLLELPRPAPALLLPAQRPRRSPARQVLNRTRLGVVGWPVAHSRSPQ